jgi:hypothetical protein
MIEEELQGSFVSSCVIKKRHWFMFLPEIGVVSGLSVDKRAPTLTVEQVNLARVER